MRCLTLVLALALPLGAQPPLAPGARVRVRTTADSLAPARNTPSVGWQLGTVVSSTVRDLILRPAPLAESVVIPVSGIQRIDLSRGRPSHWRSGAILGGLVSGGAFVALACAFSDGSCSVSDNAGGFVAYYAVGAIPGAVVGGALGSRHRGREKWAQVYPAR